MPLQRIGKKILKIIWITAGSLIILLAAFHFWVVYHAEEIIQELVESKSKGKLKLEVKNFKFNWFSRKMELQNAVFYSTDSATAGTSYRFAVRKINLKVKAMWPLIFKKQVLINGLELKDPVITVTRLRTSKDKTRGDNVSVPQEMGRIYNSIQDALEVLKVKKFELDNASFTLINKIQPDQHPISISHIDLTIHDLKVDSTKLTGREKIFFSDNIVVKSRDQDILFPDGRHRLGFSKFRINIEKKIVEFDSCTIAAVKTDKSPTGFSIFFDKLVMTDIDFDTLYRAETIKADSVYCVNPVFKLTADLDKRNKTKRNSPRLDEIIRKLTGDLMLNFVVVNNASFDIQTVRNNNPSSFRSQRNNFEMQGLRIDNDATRPLKVEKFAMAIRGYENFLRDSLYALLFDSIHVNNDRIFLNNFTFRRLNSNGKTISNFAVPRFQLSGLSWDDLLFERRLTAHKATLYDPEIDFNETPKKNSARKKRSLFEVLESVNDVLMLEDMNIVNGDIRIHLTGGTELELQKATMSVESRNLLRSNQLAGIRRSVNYLDFSKGILRIDDLTIGLDSINYTGNRSSLKAKKAIVTNTAGTINATARNVTMNEIFIDEFTGDISIGGVNWEEADIDITKLFAGKEKKAGGSFISLTDISGKNTRIHSTTADRKVAAMIDHVAATAFVLKPGEKPVIAGLDIAGADLVIAQPKSKLYVAAFAIADGQKALLEKIFFQKNSGVDSTSISIAKVSFVPDVQSAIENDIRTENMVINHPVIAVHSGLNPAENKSITLPKASINRLLIEQPSLSFSKQTGAGIWQLNWDGSNSKEPLVLTNVISDSSSFSASQLDLLLGNIIYTAANGKTINSGKAAIKTQLNDLLFEPGKSNNWKTLVTKLTGSNFEMDNLGKKNGLLKIDGFTLSDGYIDHSSTKDLRGFVDANKKIKIDHLAGSYVNTDDRFDWYNAGYNRVSQLFTLDSFWYTPMLDKDAFVKKKGFQGDYIHLKTGAAIISGFDPGLYFPDSIVKLDKIIVNDIVFDDFRDKRPLFREGIIKSLLTGRIKSIPFKLSVDSLLLKNAFVTYSELNPQTNQTGQIPISRIRLKASPVRNFNLGAKDSLVIQADGYLLDTTLLSIRLHQSYMDSLSGFLVAVHINPVDLRLLNPVLVPLSSVKIRSGELDSLIMRVNGDEYYAYGELDMYYHDLKIRLLSMAAKKNSRFKLALANFLANSFVIKNRNTKRTGLVFFVRNRERSVLNYLVKMLMSGIQSSVGVNRVRKEFRPYKKALRQRNLPPANYD